MTFSHILITIINLKNIFFPIIFSNTSHNYNDIYTEERRKSICTLRGSVKTAFMINRKKRIMTNNERKRNKSSLYTTLNHHLSLVRRIGKNIYEKMIDTILINEAQSNSGRNQR